jgi:crotonobetainyl-CoA:carnitine CoA-transferase CaiB-like acyl-CoA transferase
MENTVTDGELPLEDVTIVDITQVLAGPFSTMVLGDMGADIIKIEPPGRGDRGRSIRPSPEYFDSVNRNKRSVTVDLKSERGQEVIKRLVTDADVLIESMKPGRMDNFGLGYADLEPENPDLVYCSITGFGTGSPYETLGAWDMIIQAMSGAMSMTGEADGPPVWSGLPSGDLIAGMYTVQSVLAALLARETGEISGEWIEVPMLDTAISWLTIRAGYTFGTGEPFPRTGTQHPSIAPFGVFECRDEPLVIAAGTDSLWSELCDALGRGELVDDSRFESLDARVSNREELRSTLGETLSKRSRSEWLDVLHDHGVPAGPIYDTKSVWGDDHVQWRQLHKTMDREDREDADVIDHPVHFSNLVTELATVPETLGESTEDVLREYGYSTEDIRELRRAGVID